MSHNGKDTSGNSFKLSLIPLLIGCAVIFFLYRSCKNSVYEPKAQTSTIQVMEDEVSTSERPIVPVVDTLAQTATSTVADSTAVVKDSVAVK